MLKQVPTVLNSRKPLYLIGQGFYDCIVPTFIKNHFYRNPHIYSPYTPYQAEISQGRMELLYHYQTIVKHITNKDIAVASLLESGQIAMDLATLMKRKTGKSKLLVQSSMYQPVLNCMRTRAEHQNIELVVFENPSHILYLSDNLLKECGGIICQTPDRYGLLKDTNVLHEVLSNYPHLLTACLTDLMFLQKYKCDFDFDFVFGNATNMGIGLNYGGPQPAFLASKAHYIRDLPGKIIGKTKDMRHEDECFYLALQTREQHIKREKATSNVCTNQALLANVMSSYCLYHGESGLATISDNIHNKHNVFYNEMSNLDVKHMNHSFYNHISFEYDFYKYRNIINKLEEEHIYPHTHYMGRIGFSFDETHTKDDIEYTVNVLKRHFQKKPKTFFNYNHNCYDKQYMKKISNYYDVGQQIKPQLPMFRGDYSLMKGNEQSMLRYLTQLSKKDYSLMDGMIPLGSCTMKHTPVDSMDKITQPDMNIHPYVDVKKTKYNDVVERLTEHLKRISGFDEIFYQSQSGAMGEYAGLTIMKEYFKKNAPKKKIILMPQSAHGTNPSSCSLAGFEIRKLKETRDGFIDIDFFKRILNTHKNEIAGMMITYPSTYGLYEENIKYLNDEIHKIGGLVYMDGANMNALIGHQVPAELGFDICHFNLHKTFAIPHGGGGPGMGPIGFRYELKKYAPGFSLHASQKSISTTKYGSGLILQISQHYCDEYIDGKEESFHENVISNTKYVIDNLKDHYTILHNASQEHRAHEFIIDTSEFKKQRIKDVDIAKRLIDYGFHGPTMSWPLANSLMIEVTESEDKAEIELFIDSMKKIRQEIDEMPEIVRNAPYCEKDLLDWKFDYTIQDACFPHHEDYYKKKRKVWATHSRIESLYGDKKLLQDNLNSG